MCARSAPAPASMTLSTCASTIPKSPCGCAPHRCHRFLPCVSCWKARAAAIARTTSTRRKMHSAPAICSRPSPGAWTRRAHGEPSLRSMPAARHSTPRCRRYLATTAASMRTCATHCSVKRSRQSRWWTHGASCGCSNGRAKAAKNAPLSLATGDAAPQL